ncbi:methyltransferase-like protein 6 [Elysia marginata]|uniref:Methyltransferase-like protein 6 n=1 Tax=Elysia marginata TaxID=1093978 RepID=A0AAV4GYU4_9GAST|nr:methyltransferase-like protein 6 [Elysia marginata]
MVAAVKNIAQTLKPGGALLIRDYGLYDHAMLRFAKGHKLGDHFYVRQDGTRAYYFSLEKLSSVMEAAGLKMEKCTYIQRATINKKEGVNVPRIFVQGKFVKEVSCTAEKLCGGDNNIISSLALNCSVTNVVSSSDEHSLESDLNTDSSCSSFVQKQDSSIR